MQNYNMTVVMGADKGVQRAEELCKLNLQQANENIFAENFCKIEANACTKDSFRQ